jgi:hypothetical protein
MKQSFKILFVFALLACGTTFAGGRFFIGVGAPVPYAYAPYAYSVAVPPPVAPAYYYARPAYPGPGYTYINGYYNWAGTRYAWRPGYYVRPPFAGARWYGPRYYGGHYYHGYWRR